MKKKSRRFTDVLIEANGLHREDFQSWVFASGMLFHSPDKWWGDLGRRDFPHEGIDFCLYKDGTGQTVHIGKDIHIPAMHDGVVRALFPDYLGHAVIVEHHDTQGEAGHLVSIYAHTAPMDDVKRGLLLKQGDIFATIADTRQSKAKILPHLHYTVGRPSPDLNWDRFVWNDMRNPERFTLLDPLNAIDWPYQVVTQLEMES